MDDTDEQESFYDKIPSDFRYMGIALGVLFVSTRIVKARISHLFALILAYILIEKISERESKEKLTFNENMDYKVELLGAPEYFYIDANIINLFYSIYGWRKRNANNFDNAIKAVDNILRLQVDIEKNIARCVDNYEVATEQSKVALNLIHGFVYTLDHPLLVKKLKKVLGRLQQLLERHLAVIREHCGQQETAKQERNVNSRFIEDAAGPKPYDGEKVSPFDFY